MRRPHGRAHARFSTQWDLPSEESPQPGHTTLSTFLTSADVTGRLGS